MDIQLTEAGDEAGFAAARALFEEYARQLGVDLCFQNFGHELDHLHEIYSPPGGGLLLACAQGLQDRAVGCVGVRRVSQEICEMKRLYVQPAARGTGLGRRLALASLDLARARGYRSMVLDTLSILAPAVQLYRSLGFRETTPYYKNPLPGVVYMSLDLQEAREQAEPESPG